MNAFASCVRDVPNFPKEGIIFKDITPLLKDSEKFKELIGVFYQQTKSLGITSVVGIESRGFIFGTALAYALDASFVPARKKGKLPYRTVSSTYELEYGSDSLEMHIDALKKGERVVIVDDLLATGGTCQAVARMVESLDAEVAKILFFIELSFLQGRNKISSYDIFSALKY